MSKHRTRSNLVQNPAPREPESKAVDEKAKDDRQSPAPVIVTKLDLPHSVSSEESTQQSQSDRNEQWKLWVEIATLLAVSAYAGIAGWQGYEMRRSVVTAQQSADTATKQFELSERPWLSADLKVIESLKFDEASGTGSIGIEVMLKNMGRSLATNARVIQYLTADLVTPENVGPTEEAACGPMRGQKSQLGNVLFPGESMRITDKVTITKDVLAGAMQRVAKLGQGVWNGRILPGLITCIDYMAVSSPAHHQTRYFSEVGVKMDDFSQTGAIFPIGAYPVQLWRFFYGQYAD